MNLSAPLTDVAPGPRGALLQVLARLERPVTRRQLAAAAGVNAGHGSRVLADLISIGLVTEMKAGRASMVSLNRDHLAAPGIASLTGLREALISRLREHLAQWSDLRGAWLFGSVARGQSRPNSDVDVLIVATDLDSADLHEKVGQLHADVKRWTGNDLQLVEHSPSSWQVLKASKNPLVEQIRLDGIALTEHHGLLLRRER